MVWAVTGTISDLGTEIPHTDNHDLHEDLKERKAAREDILTRLADQKVDISGHEVHFNPHL